MQALMVAEREQAEGDNSGRSGGVTNRAESPRKDLAGLEVIPLTREMVASGAIPGMGPAERALIEHAQV